MSERRPQPKLTGCIIVKAEIGLSINDPAPDWVTIKFKGGGKAVLAPGSTIENVFMTGTTSVGRRKTVRKYFLKDDPHE